MISCAQIEKVDNVDIYFFSQIRGQLPPQMTCPRGCIITQVAFVWLFSTVCFQMCPQSACIRGCIITLLAFILHFSTVRFQMYPQIACPRGCIITLVAFVWFFSTVGFQMCPQIGFGLLINLYILYILIQTPPHSPSAQLMDGRQCERFDSLIPSPKEPKGANFN